MTIREHFEVWREVSRHKLEVCKGLIQECANGEKSLDSLQAPFNRALNARKYRMAENYLSTMEQAFSEIRYKLCSYEQAPKCEALTKWLAEARKELENAKSGYL